MEPMLFDQFRRFDSVSADDLKGLPSLTPKSTQWFSRAYGPKLNTAVKALIQHDEVDISTVGQALEFLGNVINNYQDSSPAIMPADWTGKSYSVALRQLQLAMGEQREPDALSMYRMQGLMSHQIIAPLLARQFPLTRPTPRVLPPLPKQPRLFKVKDARSTLPPSIQEVMFEPGVFSQNPWSKLPPAPLTDTLLYELRECMAELQEHVKPEVSIPDQYSRTWRTANDLRRLMYSVCGNYVLDLMKFDSILGSYVGMLTLMTWANIVFYALESHGPAPLFISEMPILVKDDGMVGGRVDAAEILVDGQPPTNGIRNQARMLAARSRCLGQFVRLLLTDHLVRGHQVIIKLKDWKVWAGDFGVTGLIRPEEAILQKFVDQVLRYLILAPIDYEIATKGEADDPWEFSRSTFAGAVWCFMPDHAPIVKDVVRDNTELQGLYKQRFVYPQNFARKQATERTRDNYVLGEVRRIYKNAGVQVESMSIVAKANKPSYVDPNQLSFMPANNRPAERLMLKHREFADPKTRIFEYCGLKKNGEPAYVLHFDHLIDALNQRKLKVSESFNLNHGGHIQCLLPSHTFGGKPERTPSLYVYATKRGGFKCFGCGASGGFAWGSIPEKFSGRVSGLGVDAFRHYSPQLDGVVVPPQHDEFMGYLYGLLRKRFRNSPAVEYLEGRNIPVEVAEKFGAGYGHQDVVADLLNAGYSYEKLVHYGVVGFSPKLWASTGLTPLLVKLGFKPDDVRVVEKTVDGDEEEKWPYFALVNRLTFPLTLGGNFTNFIGRTLDPDVEPRYIKLSKTHTDVPHGVFNEDALHKDVNEIFLAEGVFNALVASMMGHHPVAFAGSSNRLIVELIARSGKRIAYGLDPDKAGYQTTAKLPGWFKACGIEPFMTRDFTRHHFFGQDFIGPLPILKGYDLADWWEENGDKEAVRAAFNW